MHTSHLNSIQLNFLCHPLAIYMLHVQHPSNKIHMQDKIISNSIYPLTLSSQGIFALADVFFLLCCSFSSAKPLAVSAAGTLI